MATIVSRLGIFTSFKSCYRIAVFGACCKAYKVDKPAQKHKQHAVSPDMKYTIRNERPIFVLNMIGARGFMKYIHVFHPRPLVLGQPSVAQIRSVIAPALLY